MLRSTTHPSNFFTLCRFTPGRRARVVEKIRASADMLGFGPVVARCDEHLPIERRLVDEIHHFMLMRGDDGPALIRALIAADQLREGVVRGLESMLENEAMLSGRPEGDAARALLERVLPGGSDAITELSCDQQTTHIDGLLAGLDEAHDDAELAGLTGWIERLREENRAFERVFSALTIMQRLQWSALRQADADAHERFVELVAHVIDVARGPGQTDLRDELLEPVVAHEQELRSCHHRHDMTDLDPEDAPITSLQPRVLA